MNFKKRLLWIVVASALTTATAYFMTNITVAFAKKFQDDAISFN